MVSLIEAFLILPAHLSQLQRRKELGKIGRFQKSIEDKIVGFSQTVYRGWIDACVNNRYLTASVFIAALTVVSYTHSTLPTIYYV